MHPSPLAMWAWSALLLSHSYVQVSGKLVPAPELNAQDRQFFESILKDVVFDPRDATPVRCEFPRYTLGHGRKEALRDGWLVKGKPGQPDQVFFSDGFRIPAPTGLKPSDFLPRCRNRFTGDPQQRFKDVDADGFSFMLLGRNRAGIFWREEDLTLAAWLFRLGEDSLAARALAAAREEEVNFPKVQASDNQNLKSELRRNLAWKEFETLVCAFSERADETALVHGEHLLKVYPDVAKKEHPQAFSLVADLRRRKKAGRFGQKAPEQLPAELTHDPKKALAWLIGALDEVDAIQWLQPGWVELGRDWRVRELVKLGEPAVADLIEVVASDQRHCRSMHYWRNFSRDRTILGVREAALEAISSILKMPFFEPQNTADNFTRRGEAAAQEMGLILRQYWKENAKLSFDERMMKLLVDPKSPDEWCREAAQNLAKFRDERLGGGAGPPDGAISGPNPCLTKYKNPTTAEAILRAFDRDRGWTAANRAGMVDDEERRRVRQIYLSALRELDDRRIISDLTRRTEREHSTRIRLEYAETALRFRSTEAVDVLARALERGRIVFPPAPNKEFQKDLAAEELAEMVALLSEAKTPETEWALDALTLRNHPNRPTIVRLLLAHAPDENQFHRLYSCPFVVTILRQLLDDTTPTGVKFRLNGGTVESDTGNGKPTSWNVDPEELPPDWRNRQVEVPELVRDRAMTRLGGFVTGIPTFHALRADAHNRILTTKAFLDRFKGRFRLLRNAEEREKLDWRTPGPKYIPEILALEKPATALDVEAGRAVFHFAGRGKRERIKAPAWILLKTDVTRVQAPRGLVVQAERGDDGEVTFGVIFLNSIQTVRPAEIERWELYGN